MRLAVVGHVEWVDFVPVARVPVAGEVVNGGDAFARAGGGGAVAARVLVPLADHVDFFCALGEDELGHRAATELGLAGINLQVAWRDQPTRRAVTLLDDAGERTIVTIGHRLAPRGEDRLDWSAIRETDGVYLTAGDASALRRSRRARVLVATPRARAALADVDVMLDALVFSAHDTDERRWAQQLSNRARVLVATEGAAGGSWSGESEGRWQAAPPPDHLWDAYGCGDSFAAGVTAGLARGLPVGEAAALGARLGAAALAVRGAP